MVREGIGLLLMCIGGMGGDSPNLILPIVLICIGAVLVFTGKDEM